MVHASPQLTPDQLIDAGRRAEAEGRLDLAVQFYGHLAEHFADAVEAAEAHSALGRIGAAQFPLRPWISRPQRGAVRARRRPSGARRDPYRIGRALTVFFSILGGLLALTGLAALPICVLVRDAGTALPRVGLLPIAGGAAGLFIVGFGVVLVAQTARALFDQANAARDLLALERTRLGLD